MKEKFDASVFDTIPDAKIFRENLSKLKAIDLSLCTQEEIHQIVHKHTVFLPNYRCHIPKIEFNNFKLYRARFKIDSAQENIYLQSTFSYPNTAFCKENGRANLKGRNVFYCSDSPIAAILESKPIKGDMGCISIWRPNINRQVICAPFLKEDLRKQNKLHEDAKELHTYLKTITPRFKKDKAEQLDILNQFICNLYIEEGPPYSITSWLSNILLYSHESIDMLLYPSSITNSFYTNMAIHPNFADKHLILDKVFQFSINNKTDKKLDYGIGHIGLPGRMNIQWREPTGNELTEIVEALKIGIQ